MKTESKYWIVRDAQEMGPYSFELLLTLWRKNELRITDKLREDGSDSLRDVSALVPTLERAASSNPEEGRKGWALAGVVILIAGFVSILLPFIVPRGFDAMFHPNRAIMTISLGILLLVVGTGFSLGARSKK